MMPERQPFAMRRRTAKPVPQPSSNPSLRPGLLPFVGRAREQADLREQLAVASLVVVHGAVGSGKSRLVRHLAAQLDAPAAYVRSYPGDRGGALRSRAERALRCLPGGMAEALAAEVRLIVLDDVHHLADDDLAATLEAMVPPSPSLGRLIVIAREMPPLPRTLDRGELAIGGLDDAAARELWSLLEDAHGPTRAGAVDGAISRTRGMPLALRREYARAAGAEGTDPWDLARLPESTRRVLEALAVLRMPAAPAAVTALCAALGGPADREVGDALAELIRTQLVDVGDGGLHEIHDIVHDDVLAAMTLERRVALARAAADLIAGTGKGSGGRRPAWEAGDDGALGPVDPVDRLREVVLHRLAAGDVPAAVAELAERREIAARRGSSGEVEALLIAAGPGADPLIRTMRVELAARAGRISEASELSVSRGHTVDPVLVAELTLAGGDVAGAVRELAQLVEAGTADESARATAVLVELELLRGNAPKAGEMIAAAFGDERAAAGEAARAALHVAHAAVEEHQGRIAAARTALGRAQGAFKAGGVSGVAAIELGARVEARRARCLAREGRLAEAKSSLDAAEAAAREVDAVAVADELRASRSFVAMRRGDGDGAIAIARALVHARRGRGDELGALVAELDLAEHHVRRGEVVAAAELAAAAHGSSSRRKLGLLVARAELVLATIDLHEYRTDAAAVTLERLAQSLALDAASRARALVLAAEARSMLGHRAGTLDAARTAGGDEVRDELDRDLAVASVALAGGDVGAALDAARRAAQRAERAGRISDLAECLVVIARVEASAAIR